MKTGYRVVRIRNFLEHNSDEITRVRSEYTILNVDDEKPLDNILILCDDFLPNLHVTDSENVRYPLMTDSDTMKLLELDEDDGTAREVLSMIKNHKKHLIWIKIPPNRKIEPDETRIMYLDYERRSKAGSKLRFRRQPVMLYIDHSGQSSLFFTLKKPRDYDIDTPKVNRRGSVETSMRDDESFRYDETDTSIIFHVKPDSNAIVSYRPRVKLSVMLFPAFALGLLTLFAGVFLAVSVFHAVTHDGIHASTTHPFFQDIIDRRIELLVFIASASIAVPQLIPNVAIRNKKSYMYLIPMALALMSIFLPPFL